MKSGNLFKTIGSTLFIQQFKEFPVKMHEKNKAPLSDPCGQYLKTYFILTEREFVLQSLEKVS